MTQTATETRQPLKALRHANEIRVARAQWKARVRAAGPEEGRRIAANLLLTRPPAFQTMKVWHALVVIPGWGQVRARRALLRAGVAEGRRIGSLTDRQVEELAMELGVMLEWWEQCDFVSQGRGAPEMEGVRCVKRAGHRGLHDLGRRPAPAGERPR